MPNCTEAAIRAKIPLGGRVDLTCSTKAPSSMHPARTGSCHSDTHHHDTGAAFVGMIQACACAGVGEPGALALAQLWRASCSACGSSCYAPHCSHGAETMSSRRTIAYHAQLIRSLPTAQLRSRAVSALPAARPRTHRCNVTLEARESPRRRAGVRVYLGSWSPTRSRLVCVSSTDS